MNRDFTNLFNRVADFLLLLLFLFVVSIGRPVVDPSVLVREENVTISRIYFYSQMLSAVFLSIFCFVNIGRARWNTSIAFFIPYIFIVITSLIVTVDFTTSLNHLLRLVAIVASTDLYIRLRGPREMIRILAITLLLVNVLSIIAVFAFPSIGKHSATENTFLANAGNWRGITQQKNALGRFGSIGAVLLIAYSDMMNWPKLLSYAFGAICVANVFGSQSGTGIIALVVCMALYFRVGGRNTSPIWDVFLLVGVAALVGVMLLAPDMLFDLLGKDASGTGRTRIWAFCWDVIRSEPLLGYGFDAGAAYWRPVMQSVIFPSAVDAHNAYIQTVVDLGWGGLIALGAALFMALRAAFRQNPRIDEPTRRANTAFGVIIVGAMVVGCSEISSFSITSDVGFMTFIAIAGISTNRRFRQEEGVETFMEQAFPSLNAANPAPEQQEA